MYIIKNKFIYSKFTVICIRGITIKINIVKSSINMMRKIKLIATKGYHWRHINCIPSEYMVLIINNYMENNNYYNYAYGPVI